MTASNTTPSLTLTSADLDGLRRQAGKDPRAAVKGAAQQFESLFMQQILKAMRDAVPQGGLTGSDTEKMWTGMLDQQLAQKMSGQRGGLGEMIERQLLRAMGKGQPVTPASASTPSTSTPASSMPTMWGSRSGEGMPVTMRQGQAASAHELLIRSKVAEALRAQSTQRAGASPDGVSAMKTSFVDRVWRHAQQAERATGVPAAFVVGQAALESGWGRRELAGAAGQASHNLFGIKATADWKGRTVDAVTTEYVDGQARRTVQKFRAYDSYADAFTDWAGLMLGRDRYAHALKAGSAAEFAQRIGASGYATDPAYGSKLQRVIEQTVALRQQAR